MSFQSLQLPLPLPEAVRPWLTLIPEFCIIICHAAKCQQAITPDNINNHLSRTHTVQLEHRKQLAKYLEQWQWPYDFRSVPLPLDRSLPQPVLPITNGFQCQDCVYKSTSRGKIRKHCNIEHNKKRLPDEQLFQAVQLQTWFAAKRARYWVVDVDATRLPRDDNNNRNEVKEESGSCSASIDTSTTIKAEVAEWIKKEEEEDRYEVSTLATEVDPWLRYTGWEEVLAGSQHGLVETAAFAATATDDETELEPVIESWKRILQRSLSTLVAVGNYKDILKWWGSPKNEVAGQRPFERPQEQTVSRYSQTFARLLYYVLRTATGSVDDKTETGVRFSEPQIDSVKRVRSAIAVADNDRERDVALMGLIISLIGQDMSQLPLYESPVLHYMAVRGIDLKTKAFSSSFQYTPLLAHMIWMIRLLLLELTISEHGWPEFGIQSRAELGAVAGAVAESIQLARKKYLCEGSFSPASSILSQLAFGQRLNRNHSCEANIYWSDDRQTVFYDGKGVAMAKVRSMCRSLTTELEDLLHELLFHQAVAPVPLPQLVDSMGTAQRFQQKGYSFLDHPDNARWKISWEFLWQRMLQDGQGLVTSRGNDGNSANDSSQLEWAEQPCKAYLALERQFLLKLMVPFHIQGGPPLRSPEIGSIKVRNSVTSSRNLFVINGRVAVVTTYDKARNRRGKSQYVFRCFPDQLSQVIVQYLVYVLPFTRVVQKTKGDFLFATEQEPWIKDQLSGAVAVATAKHLGVRLTVSSWRQIAIAISDEYLRKASRVWKQDQEDAEEGVAVEEESEREAEQNIFEQILVRQSGHSKRTAEIHYAIDGAFLNRLGPDLVSAYSQASRAWHAFLQLESKGAAVVVGPAKRAASPLQPEVKRVRLTPSPGLQGLQKIFGPESQPRSEGQAHALELVHTATASQPQIIILGTGSGKSVLFFSVAAMVSQQTIIVIVPFAALVDDLVTRARSHHLTCEEWRWQREWKLLPQLLIVSADRAVDGDFLHFAKGLELNKQLAHVFFDECHVAVTDTSYRAKLRELWQLRYLTCRFTCLTATLLTCLEPVLRANLLLECAPIYRQSTIRRTIRYTVIDCHRQGIWEPAFLLIRTLPMPAGSRGIIYVRSYADGEKVAEEINCPFYKATASDKQPLLDQWARGSGGWIVATGALGTGINISGVVYVLHLGRPYGLTSFMQQSGRGGRAGEVSNSIVILPSSSEGGHSRRTFPPFRHGLLNTYSVEAQDEAALTQFLESSTCRRAVLADAFDGCAIGVDCHSTDSVLCDQCQLGHSVQSRGNEIDDHPNSEVIHEALQVEIRQNEQLEQFHQQLHSHCIFCQLMCNVQASHCHRDCPEAAWKGCDVTSYRQWRSRLKLAPRHQCFRCGLSQNICTAVEDQTSCTYPHLMLPGLFFLHQVGYLVELGHELGFQGEAEELWPWLNRAHEGIRGRQEINWMRMWRRVGEFWDQSEERGTDSTWEF